MTSTAGYALTWCRPGRKPRAPTSTRSSLAPSAGCDAGLGGLTLRGDAVGAGPHEHRVDGAIDVHVLGKGEQRERSHRAAGSDDSHRASFHRAPDQRPHDQMRLTVVDGADVVVADLGVV